MGDIFENLISPLVEAADRIDDTLVRPFSKPLGVPDDQVRIIVCWLLMIPIGWFFHFFIRGRHLRHYVNVLFGTLGMTYFFGREIWQVCAMTGVTWLLMAYTPRHKSQNYATFFVFGFLSMSQLAVVVYR